MKMGVEDKKKVWTLAGLGAVAAYLFYANVLSGPGAGPSPAPPKPAATASVPAPSQPRPAAATPAAGASIRRATPGRAGRGDEFRPSLKPKRAEDRVDPAAIDPTLRLDLLAKVQGVSVAGGSRNVFQFGTPPPAAALTGKEPIVMPGRVYGPKPPEPEKPKEAKVEPPPPPINLKYYGFSMTRGGARKTAFFLDGEDILVAPEGGTVKQRYKVVRIGVTSVLMEDTASKRQQSLPLQEDVPGAG
jgi:hypothetical protein